MINNANWAEWSVGKNLAWNHTCDFKIERAHNLIAQIQDFSQYQYLIDSVVVSKQRNRKLTSHFVCKTETFRRHVHCNFIVISSKPWNLTGCFVSQILFHWLGKRSDLEQKIVPFVNQSHCWEPIRLQGSPVISKGCNKAYKLITNGRSSIVLLLALVAWVLERRNFGQSHFAEFSGVTR